MPRSINEKTTELKSGKIRDRRCIHRRCVVDWVNHLSKGFKTSDHSLRKVCELRVLFLDFVRFENLAHSASAFSLTELLPSSISRE